MTSHNWTVEFPELIDDEYLIDGDANLSGSFDGQQPASIRPRIGCFIYTLKLCCIKDDILSTFYGTPKTQAPPNGLQDRLPTLDFTAMVELNRRVNEFEATLPSWLVPSAYQESLGASVSECFALQANVLRARFLHTRLLLFRPVLLEYIKKVTLARTNPTSANETDLSQQFYVYASNRCVATTHEIIAHLHANLSSTAQPAPWYVAYFTLMAATSLIAAKTCSNISINIPGTTFEMSWNRCTEILGHLEDLGQSAVQGVAVLNSLYQRVYRSLQPCETYSGLIPVGGGSDDNPFIQPMDAYAQNGPMFCPSDSFILRNPLTGEDWLRSGSLNLDWLDIEAQDTTYLDN